MTPETRDGRLDFALIGASDMGMVVAKALANAGHRLIGVASDSRHDPDRVGAMLADVPQKSAIELIASAELLVLALPTPQMTELLVAAANEKLWRNGQLVMHLSPDQGFGILAPATEQGAIPLALFPCFVPSGTSLDLTAMRDCYVAVTAPRVVIPIAQALVYEMGAEPIVVEEADRALLAEAISVATDFSKMVVNQSIGLLQEIGVNQPHSLLGPLIRSAVEQALSSGHQSVSPEDIIGGD